MQGFGDNETSQLAQDTTGRDGKPTAEALRYSEAELRSVIDSVPGLIAYIDREERYRFANIQYQEWFKISREAIVGRTAKEVLGAAYPPIKDKIARALAGERVTFEATLDYPDKRRTVWVQYTPDLDETGAVRGFHALVMDITARKQAADAQRDQQRFTQTIIESAPTLTYIYDLHEQRNIFISPQTLPVLGYTAAEVGDMGANVLPQLLHPEDAPRAAARLEQILAARGAS